MINRITLDYHRVTKFKSLGELEENAETIWDYSEHLMIDRTTESLEYIRDVGSECKISHKYEIGLGVESLLEDLSDEDLFSNITGNPDDVVETPNETRDYTIVIDYKESPQQIISGTFDKNGLPEDFAYFIEMVSEWMEFYDSREIFDASIYGKVKRRKSDYIYCSVIFDGGYKSYYYLSDDDSIKIGDFVLVPAGRNNHEAIVEVADIEYFSKENVPLPLEKTK